MRKQKIRAIYQSGQELYHYDNYYIREAVEDERIFGSAGWVDTYLVYSDTSILARVPAWSVVVEYVI